jgi:hypothetical protein
LAWQASWHSGNEFFQQRAMDRDHGQRQVVRDQIQRLMNERAVHAPISESVTLHSVGPRVEKPVVGMHALRYFAAPYEEMRLKQP